MLVLSRRPDEKILLPTVPAIIKVISSQSSLTRLGVEAPSHVPILRAELAHGSKMTTVSATHENGDGSDAPDSPHEMRNRVNNLILALTILRMQMTEANLEIRSTLNGMEEQLQALRRRLVSSPSSNKVAGVAPKSPT